MSIDIRQILAASPNTERGRPTQLSTDPKGERIAYASGKSVFLRSIDNPSLSKQYTSHIYQTTVARFSPSGYYIASGDVSGTVKIWDAVGAINTKGEYQIISGRINDIAWDGDSQRLIAIGDGRGRSGHCITADSGNSVGDIVGHASAINTVSIRHQRPIRAATGADDSSLVFLHGVPFRFNDKFESLHKGYIYGVSFSPDGNKLVSVGADRRIQLYDGKSGNPDVDIGAGEHKGSIFGVSWSSDSKKIVTASADQTVKLWDVEIGKAVQTWRFGSEEKSDIFNHQVGITWPAARSDGMIISLNLAGDLSYLIQGNEKPIKIIQGHNKNITAMGSSQNNKGQTLWTGSFDGRVCSWDIESCLGSRVEGESHKNQVIAFQTTTERAYSVGWDDMLRIADINDNNFLKKATKLCAQPVGLDSADGRIFIANAAGFQIFSKDELVAEHPIKDFTVTAIAVSKSLVALGSDKNTVHIFIVDQTYNVTFERELTKSKAKISSLCFNPGGTLLAVGDSLGKIIVYDTKSWEIETDRWSAHTARVLSISWNPEGTHAVSGGLDTNIYVWSLKHPGNRIKAPNAHKGSVNGVSWLGTGCRIVSSGEDASVKIWDVSGLE
ncbi:putative WD repeat-containing protein C9G1.05 [Erysiphe neolycopersici]|uniref:Putative WD repeat-containing protein C9G1.05 n=1 Tax=Erysiphe neolycopersici TaxID=212602 RepID=A0A420HZ99_9PEZI|nr:putative WD repeat-containing protein C9G1.05 [Erysiphe neolycopersici]